MSRVRPPEDTDAAERRAWGYLRDAQRALDRLQECRDADVADLGEAMMRKYHAARDATGEMMRFFSPGSGSPRPAYVGLSAALDAMREVDLGVLRERLRDKRMAARDAESKRLRDAERARFDGDSFGKELAIMRGRR